MGELVQAFMKEAIGDKPENKQTAKAPYMAAKAAIGLGLIYSMM